MKYESYITTLPLSGSSIDLISEKTEEFLRFLKTENANIVRIRLSLEEALLRWRDRFGETANVSVFIGKRLRQYVITLELAGESYNPLESAGNELDNWSDSLLSSIGLTPKYTYANGKNTVQLNLQKPQINSALTLLFAIIAGLLVGALTQHFSPASFQTFAVTMVLEPVHNMFFRLLNLVAGPVIVLSIIVAICGAGSVAASGKNGRRLISRFILMSFVITTAACLLAAPLFSLRFTGQLWNDTRFSGLLDLMLQIFPNDVFMPFVEGNSPQIILIAVVIGNALLLAGSSAQKLVSVIEQANNTVILIVHWFNRLIPYFIFLLLILEIWKGSVWIFFGIWRPILLFLCIIVILFALYVGYICGKKRIRVQLFLKKLAPSFLLALKSASVDTAYGKNLLCCEKKLGIDPKLTAYAIPLGLVIFMPAGSVACLLFTLYAAESYGIAVSLVWFALAVILTVMLMVATPPVPGVGLLAYAAVFSQLGIPAEALAIAMIADILFGFFVAAFNQALLQTELVLQADHMGLLQDAVLQNHNS